MKKVFILLVITLLTFTSVYGMQITKTNRTCSTRDRNGDPCLVTIYLTDDRLETNVERLYVAKIKLEQELLEITPDKFVKEDNSLDYEIYQETVDVKKDELAEIEDMINQLD